MDLRRIALFAAFAAVTVLLLTKWNATNVVDDVALANAQTSEQSVNEDVIADSNNVSDEIGDETNTNSSGSQYDEVSQSGAPVVKQQVQSTNIEINTDVLKVKINSNGGDLIYASLTQYPVALDNPETPFTLLNENDNYHFIAQSFLKGLSGDLTDKTSQRIQYSSDQTSYSLEEGQDTLTVVLTSAEVDGVKVEKVYEFTRSNYNIKTSYRVINNSDVPQNVKYEKRLQRDDSSDPTKLSAMGASSFIGFAHTSSEEAFKEFSFPDMVENSFEASQLGKKSGHIVDSFENPQGGFVAFSQKYFLTAWISEKNDPQRYQIGLPVGKEYFYGISSGFNKVVEPGQTRELTSSIFIGPKIRSHLLDAAENMQKSIDYSFLWWASTPLIMLLTWIHDFVPNWGWSIVILTIIVKTAFYPLSKKSWISMAKMRKFAPKMTDIRDRYKDDRQKQSQEMMKLYQKEKINPMGGCLPMLIQMPIFIALYWALNEAVEIRQMPWMWWIQDLSNKDPFYILPILMGVSMFVQMQMQQQPNMDPMQQKMFKIMPIFFAGLFIVFPVPAGLVLYWVVSNTITIIQQFYVNKIIVERKERLEAEALQEAKSAALAAKKNK